MDDFVEEYNYKEPPPKNATTGLGGRKDGKNTALKHNPKVRHTTPKQRRTNNHSRDGHELAGKAIAVLTRKKLTVFEYSRGYRGLPNGFMVFSLLNVCNLYNLPGLLNFYKKSGRFRL